MAKKLDPIRKKYYKPLEEAELYSSIFCYSSWVLSYSTLLLNKQHFPTLSDISQILFLVSVIALCLTSVVIRLYLAPRAQEHRYKDFLSHAFNITQHEQTKGYYNNSETNPLRRIAAQVLENSFYSKSTLGVMIKKERFKIFVFFMFWFLLLVNRSTGLNTLVLVTQIIFSELLISRWFLMEFFKYKAEKVFDNLFSNFKNKPTKIVFETTALEMNGIYEMAKANSCITLSEKTFIKKSNEFDLEWKQIRKTLGI